MPMVCQICCLQNPLWAVGTVSSASVLRLMICFKIFQHHTWALLPKDAVGQGKNRKKMTSASQSSPLYTVPAQRHQAKLNKLIPNTQGHWAAHLLSSLREAVSQTQLLSPAVSTPLSSVFQDASFPPPSPFISLTTVDRTRKSSPVKLRLQFLWA